MVEQGTDRPLAGVSIRIEDGFDVPTAVTDAQGRFDGIPAPGTGPTSIAWVPGLAGPAVATMKADEPLRLVLPAAAVASGRVTIGGRPVEASDSWIRVVLAAEDRGAVDVAMGRETVADADGRFRFVGPAPGRYVVQAVRNELWDSKPVTLVVEAGKEAAPIELDVPEPGSSMALRLVDRRGEPAASVSIPRSVGTNAVLPPITARTDARGEAILRGSPAGAETLTVEGDPTPHALDVPPARLGTGPTAVVLEVDRRSP